MWWSGSKQWEDELVRAINSTRAASAAFLTAQNERIEDANDHKAMCVRKCVRAWSVDYRGEALPLRRTTRKLKRLGLRSSGSEMCYMK